MPTTRKTLKAVQDGLKTALVLAAKQRDRETVMALRSFYDGRADGIRTALKLVDELCR